MLQGRSNRPGAKHPDPEQPVRAGFARFERLMQSKKELLASAVVGLGLRNHLARFQSKGLVILAYHRIRADHPGSETIFDEGVFGPTQASFDRQVKWLKENFDLVSESDILDIIRSRSPYKHRCVGITFDDGYRDNYALALPVLRRHSAPAIFFVCPGLIDSRRLGWWDLIAYLVKKSKKPSGAIDGELLSLGPQAASTIETLQDRMKLKRGDRTATLIEDLSKVCEVPLPDPELQASQLMTWDQISEAASSRVAIGSHTHTHPVLATIDENAQRREMEESKLRLEQCLGTRVRTIAYPVGKYGCRHDEDRSRVRLRWRVFVPYRREFPGEDEPL
jgi:peptidoglycan/xylan/chitin deacetylase (PgdA/CDA1 family)